MGRLIEESRVVEILQQTWLSGTIAHRFVDDITRRIRIEVPTVEAIPKDQYEARLKADMVAMLEGFDLELSEYEDADLIRVEYIEYIRQMIQDKIDALKGGRNEN